MKRDFRSLGKSSSEEFTIYAKLKWMYAELALENTASKDVFSRKR
jgi:hypothetical protein